jgi:hypothetical protein
VSDRRIRVGWLSARHGRVENARALIEVVIVLGVLWALGWLVPWS